MDWEPVVIKTLERVTEYINQQPAIMDRNLLYFGATDVIAMGSGSIQRYKQYWKNTFQPNEIDSHEFEDCVELLVRKDNDRLVYATCASVSEKHLPVLFESLRRGLPGFISIPANPQPLSEHLVRELYEESMDDSLHSPVDKERICELICSNGGVHLGIYGWFDDRELEIYMHYRPDLVRIQHD